MNVNKLDTEKFICEVQKFPQIWDLHSEDYRYKKRKQRAWYEVASVIIPGFDQFPDSEKVVTCKKLNDKWRNLRDSFVRAKRINSKRNYMYARHLEFLKEVYKSSSQSESEEGVDEMPKEKVLKKKRHSEEVWNSEGDYSNLEFVNTYADTPYTAINYGVQEEDKLFFDSLLPAVREFSLDQKLEFRTEVISLVKKIRSMQS